MGWFGIVCNSCCLGAFCLFFGRVCLLWWLGVGFGRFCFGSVWCICIRIFRCCFRLFLCVCLFLLVRRLGFVCRWWSCFSLFVYAIYSVHIRVASYKCFLFGLCVVKMLFLQKTLVVLRCFLCTLKNCKIQAR